MTEIRMIIRSIVKDKGFFLIILFGFSVGLACSALILSVFVKQTSSDSFLTRVNQKSFRVLIDNVLTGKRNVITFGDLSQKLSDSYPEVLSSTRIYAPELSLIGYKGVEIPCTKLVYSDSSFFKVFSYTLQGHSGDRVSPQSVFIKRSALETLFHGTKDVLNEIITIDDKPYYVAGIIDDRHQVSHLDFDIVAQLSSLDNNADPFSYPGLTYISLAESADELEFTTKLNEDAQNLVPSLPKVPKFYLQPVDEIFFGERFEALDNVLAYGNSDYIRMLTLIAGIVLLVASINYLNLSYARSLSGFRRIAIQRVLGVTSSRLFKFFLAESFLVILGSVLLALLLLALFGEPAARQLQLDFAVSDLTLPVFIALFADVILIVTVCASLYNMWKLNDISLYESLRNQLTGIGGIGRTFKGLTAFQFFVSGGLLMALTIVSRQVAYVENFDTGFKMRELIQLDLSNAEVAAGISVLESELMSVPGIASVSLCSGSPLNGSWHTTTRNADEEISINILFGDEGFMETLGLALLRGRNFAGDSSDRNAVIANAAFVKLLNVDDPLNHQFEIGDQRFRIIGVVDNFTTESLMVDASKPGIIRRLMTREKSTFGSSILIRVDKATDPGIILNGEPFKRTLDAYVEGISTPKVVSAQFNELHAHELAIGSWIRWFAVISTIMTCFGLVGLLSFTQQARTKEVVVRKLLGASLFSLYATMAKGALRLALIGMVVAIPCVYLLMSEWLNRFVYKADIELWIFAAGTLAILAITLLTITYHSLQMIRTNIAEKLKSE